MSKKILFSLFTATILLPVLAGSALAFPGYGKKGHGGECSGYHGYMGDGEGKPYARAKDPKIVEMVKPVHIANKSLFMALEEGDIKKIQKEAKNLADAIKKVTDPELKKGLENAMRIATEMSKTSTYKELRTGYTMIKRDVRKFHIGKKGFSKQPMLKVDVETEKSIASAQIELKALFEAIQQANDADINARIDALSATIASIKMKQLQEYTAPILVTLADMKKAKNVLEKATYQQGLFGRVTQLSMITQSK